MSEEKTLVEVKNLKQYFDINMGMFKTKPLKAVDDISFTIKKGETLGLVGESGCGKTTAGRSILHLYKPTAGEVIFDGKKVDKSTMQEYRTKATMVFQDPYSSLNPRMTVADIIAEPLDIHKLYTTKEERQERVLELMNYVGLNSEHASRYAHEFSGGQRQRICIARALALNPDFILCDEPVSALDVSIQAQIINLLRSLQKEFGLTYLFISHDLSVVEHISDTVGVMYLGNMVEFAPTETLFKNPLHPYTEALFSAIPIPDPDYQMHRIILEGSIPSPANPPKGCKFHTRCRKCMEICKYADPNFKLVEDEHFVACHLYNTEEENKIAQHLTEEAKKAEKEEAENQKNGKKK